MDCTKCNEKYLKKYEVVDVEINIIPPHKQLLIPSHTKQEAPSEEGIEYIFIELFRRSHSEMDNSDYQQWYECVQKLYNDYNKGIRGIELTKRWDEHPEYFDVPCICKLCRSYGD